MRADSSAEAARGVFFGALPEREAVRAHAAGVIASLGGFTKWNAMESEGGEVARAWGGVLRVCGRSSPAARWGARGQRAEWSGMEWNEVKAAESRAFWPGKDHAFHGAEHG